MRFDRVPLFAEAFSAHPEPPASCQDVVNTRARVVVDAGRRFVDSRGDIAGREASSRWDAFRHWQLHSPLKTLQPEDHATGTESSPVNESAGVHNSVKRGNMHHPKPICQSAQALVQGPQTGI